MKWLLLSTGNVGTAALAQLGERQTEDLKVPGSIPGGGTLPARGSRTQAVKGVDQKSTGLCPRRFESCRLRSFAFSGHLAQWQSTGLVNLGSRVRSSQWPSFCAMPMRRLSSVAEHWSCKPRVGSSILPVALFAKAVTGNRTRVSTATTWCSDH